MNTYRCTPTVPFRLRTETPTAKRWGTAGGQAPGQQARRRRASVRLPTTSRVAEKPLSSSSAHPCSRARRRDPVLPARSVGGRCGGGYSQKALLTRQPPLTRSVGAPWGVSGPPRGATHSAARHSPARAGRPDACMRAADASRQEREKKGMEPAEARERAPRGPCGSKRRAPGAQRRRPGARAASLRSTRPTPKSACMRAAEKAREKTRAREQRPARASERTSESGSCRGRAATGGRAPGGLQARVQAARSRRPRPAKGVSALVLHDTMAMAGPFLRGGRLISASSHAISSGVRPAPRAAASSAERAPSWVAPPWRP